MRKLLKKIYLKLKGRVQKHLKKGIECNYKWYGNAYAGFYICPDLLSKNSIVYSFGIGEDISFDRSVIEEFQCTVFGFDPTPKSEHWISNQNLPDGFYFYNYGINNITGTTNFYLPKNPDYVSGSLVTHNNVASEYCIQVQMKSFKDIVDVLGHKKIDVLKMDIEGSEYNVLEHVLDSDTIIDQVLIEFHDRFFKDGKAKTAGAIHFLQAKGYEIFAVSDTLEEVSFIRKDTLK